MKFYDYAEYLGKKQYLPTYYVGIITEHPSIHIHTKSSNVLAKNEKKETKMTGD